MKGLRWGQRLGGKVIEEDSFLKEGACSKIDPLPPLAALASRLDTELPFAPNPEGAITFSRLKRLNSITLWTDPREIPASYESPLPSGTDGTAS